MSKLSVGSLSAIDKLETQLTEMKRDEIGPKAASQSSERISKLEADFHKLARLFKGSQDVILKLESR